MKYLFYFLALASVILTSCDKKTTGLTVDEYIKQNNLKTTELSEGVHILYRKKTTGQKPNIDSKVTTKYKGYLTDGTVFDQNTKGISFALSRVIRGWQIGIRDMSIGSDATLIIPADQGYGSRGSRSIPPNSTLVFDVELLDIK